MMLTPIGLTVPIIWTLGVEVERWRWRDWPSTPGVGKGKAEVGDSRSILEQRHGGGGAAVSEIIHLWDMRWDSSVPHGKVQENRNSNYTN